MFYNDRKQQLISAFEDTRALIAGDEALQAASDMCALHTRLYEPEEEIGGDAGSSQSAPARIEVKKAKTFETALRLCREYPDQKVGVLNFASATRPGGGVLKGSSAQEESLCRCSTLYDSLNQDWLKKRFYEKNRREADPLHTDACIYSPGVVIVKSDSEKQERLPEKERAKVDVLSCAAPNLRAMEPLYTDPESRMPVYIEPGALYEIHRKRISRILQIARANGVKILVLGAFGCGAFRNDPRVVARAFQDVLPGFMEDFCRFSFAIYCRQSEYANYEAFKNTFNL